MFHLKQKYMNSTDVHTSTSPAIVGNNVLPAVPHLVKARNCNGCWAYSTDRWREGRCSLGFDVQQLGKNATSGRYANGDYWAFYCKPKEPCMKPKTGKQYIAAMSARHGR